MQTMFIMYRKYVLQLVRFQILSSIHFWGPDYLQNYPCVIADI